MFSKMQRTGISSQPDNEKAGPGQAGSIFYSLKKELQLAID